MKTAEGQPAQAISVMVLNGLPLGGNFLSNSILADVIDYDEVCDVLPARGCLLLCNSLLLNNCATIALRNTMLRHLQHSCKAAAIAWLPESRRLVRLVLLSGCWWLFQLRHGQNLRPCITM